MARTSETFIAERALLGAALVNPSTLATVTITPDDFGDHRLREIFKTIRDVEAKGTGIDLVTVKSALAGSGRLENAGGIAYLSALVDGLPRANAESVERWQGIVRDGSKRRAIRAAADAMVAALDSNESAAAAVEAGRLELDRAERAALPGELRHGTDIEAGLRQLRTPSRDRGPVSGITDLDRIVGSLDAGNVVILAARPGEGKTALAVNIAEGVAKRNNGVLFISAEMTAAEIGRRRIIAETGIIEARLSGDLDMDDAVRVEKAVLDLSARPLYVIEGTPSVTEMRAAGRVIASKPHGLALIVVDYLQLLAGTGGKYQNRENVVAELSRALKGMARDLRVPVLACCQLNRGVENREGSSEPRLSDLRESGSIEQDASIVLALHRTGDDTEVVNVIALKNRHRARGRCQLRFRGDLFRFESIATWGTKAA